MSQVLKTLLKRSAEKPMSAEEREQQRKSFAYGNTKFENDRITRETIEHASAEIARRNATGAE